MALLWRKDDRASLDLSSGVRKVQAAESRVPGASPGRAWGNLGLASESHRNYVGPSTLKVKGNE
ncbi:MAG: hypothetical protein UX13_C0037G0015 [Candidatus Woesebacteria bacterium GW2011_GWB1_45_5]|uniref:Uncharacterized protein n=1 Tax=Candidatus Woesebacteria bacterium GW2011_GWB1_45_5 TaxID=1618581 RepID=A0A0G1MMJ6_9BACT|nr:MAG: hypothetical protein UX13_C0037G0015 [Candidatus Woesebacteria bacterium GW2011_GWB1_45_5]